MFAEASSSVGARVYGARWTMDASCSSACRSSISAPETGSNWKGSAKGTGPGAAMLTSLGNSSDTKRATSSEPGSPPPVERKLRRAWANSPHERKRRWGAGSNARITAGSNRALRRRSNRLGGGSASRRVLTPLPGTTASRSVSSS
ncbi:hypothetical protein COSO111634_32345 [Corallococcus soli]